MNIGTTPIGNRKYYTLVTAQIVFRTVRNGLQLITQSTFGCSDEPTFPAAYLLRLQNTLISQVKQKVNQESPDNFIEATDVVILALQPLGVMSHEEFWEGMNTPAPSPEPLADVPVDAAEPVNDLSDKIVDIRSVRRADTNDA